MTTTDDTAYITLTTAEVMERLCAVIDAAPIALDNLRSIAADLPDEMFHRAVGELIVLGYVEGRGDRRLTVVELFTVADDYIGGPWPSVVTPTPAQRAKAMPATFVATARFVDSLTDAQRSAYHAGTLRLVDLEGDGVRVVPLRPR